MKENKAIDRIAAIAEKLAREQGYELVEAAFEKEHTGMYLRFYIDIPRGISLDDCERFHTALQPKMEPFDYDFMEVCSPGADRPIKTARDAEKARGRIAEAKLYKPLNGQKTITGTFLNLDEEGYHILQNGAEVVLKPKDIAVIRCQIDLSVLDEQPQTNQYEEENQR